MNLDYISRRFLDELFDYLEGLRILKQKVVLRVVRPEGTSEFPLNDAIVTYAPSNQEIVFHFGVKTIQVFLRGDWVEMQCQAPASVCYMKQDVYYQFVRV